MATSKHQSDYTRKRELAHIIRTIRDDEKYKQELIKMYGRTMERIVKQTETSYMRFAGKEGLTIAEARKRVSAFDVASFGDRVKEIIKEKDFSERARYELSLYNLKMRMSRLDLIKREMLIETLALADEEHKALEKRLTEKALDELNRQAGILGLEKATRKAIVSSSGSIVLTSLHSATFSDRIWSNQKELIARLERGLERSILLGQNPKQWSSTLRTLVRKEMTETGRDNGLHAANRIAITEVSRVQTEIAIKSFQKGGYKRYIWIAEPTACPICLDLHGKVYDVEESEIGTDLPPMHPFCRCSVAAYEEY